MQTAPVVQGPDGKMQLRSIKELEEKTPPLERAADGICKLGQRLRAPIGNWRQTRPVVQGPDGKLKLRIIKKLKEKTPLLERAADGICKLGQQLRAPMGN